MKILFFVFDGLGDENIKQLGNKTPLEKAKTPNLDYLSKKGLTGLLEPCFTTAIPTSEQGHFSLFGYDVKNLSIKRGIFTARGVGMKVEKGDVALRGNFGTIAEDFTILDRRAGRINNTQPLIKSLKKIKVDNVKFVIKSAFEHRLGIVLKGKNLDYRISDGDPFYSKLGRKAEKIIPLNKKAAFTANAVNEFLDKAHQILKNHALNKKREKLGFAPANYVLVRGASSVQKPPSFFKKYGFKACCVAGKILYQEIARSLGMKIIKVKGANGLVSTNIDAKIQAVKKAFGKYNFVFLHIKATDTMAEDGNFLAKKKFIEKVDRKIKPLLALKDALIVVTADHSTCSLLKRHCDLPIPVLIYGAGKDSVERFSEKGCRKGDLGKIKQTDLMPKILKIVKKLKH